MSVSRGKRTLDSLLPKSVLPVWLSDQWPVAGRKPEGAIARRTLGPGLMWLM